MRALVTGGAGFIGSALVRALALDDVPVACLDVLNYAGDPDNLAGVLEPGTPRFRVADVRDAAMVAEFLESFEPSIVFHLAAETHVDRSIDSPAEFFKSNIEGTYALLSVVAAYWNTLDERAAKDFRFLQVSTDEVFGSTRPDEPFDESSRYAPNSPYAASKGSADYLVRTWSMASGLPVLIAHGSNTYGARQFPEKLVPLMLLNALEGRTLPIYGDGQQIRDWIHVDDHVAGLRAIATRGRPGESYIVSARNPRTNAEIVGRICDLCDAIQPEGAPHATAIEHVTDRPGHDRCYVSRPDKIERELGWRAQVPFEEGLASTVEWYRANAEWCARIGARYDRTRLGLGVAS